MHILDQLQDTLLISALKLKITAFFFDILAHQLCSVLMS